MNVVRVPCVRKNVCGRYLLLGEYLVQVPVWHLPPCVFNHSWFGIEEAQKCQCLGSSISLQWWQRPESILSVQVHSHALFPFQCHWWALGTALLTTPRTYPVQMIHSMYLSNAAVMSECLTTISRASRLCVLLIHQIVNSHSQHPGSPKSTIWLVH